MMQIFSRYYSNDIVNITPLCKSIGMSGDKGQVARKLDISLAYPIFDTNQPKPQVGPGTKIWATLDGKEIFRGVIWDRGISSNEELTITAYDYLIYLSKSKVTYNFKNISADNATRKVCSELGITAGSLASTGNLSRVLQAKTGYEAVMEMYTQASKVTGKQYIPVMGGTSLDVIVKGSVIAGFSLISKKDSNTSNVLSSSFTDSLESMVNRVKIYNDKDELIGQVQNASWINDFGVMQENYTKEADKNQTTVATNMLNGIDRNVTIETIGNWDCRTGYAVRVKIFYLDVLRDTVMYIDGDTHTWDVSTGKYTMSLTLNFKNIMDVKES